MGIYSKQKTRDVIITAKMTEAENELLEYLAIHHNVNKSELLRYLIAKEARELGFYIPERLKYETT